MKDGYLNHLISLTGTKNTPEIKTYLEKLPSNIKGIVFENYLELLFKHNGWKVRLTGKKSDAGADLLLYHHGNENPDFIIQVKNWNKPLDETNVASELTKFETKASLKYRCNQYQLFSIKGYSKEASKYSRYNIKLQEWSDIVNLINNYQTKIPDIPPIDLFSHNQRAFHSIMKMFKKSNRVCVSHATGTGKSYLIGSLLQKNQNKKTLMVAPTKIILSELKEKFHYLMKDSILMTYSKLSILKRDEVENYELLILDEFHRAGAIKWGGWFKANYSGESKKLNFWN